MTKAKIANNEDHNLDSPFETREMTTYDTSQPENRFHFDSNKNSVNFEKGKEETQMLRTSKNLSSNYVKVSENSFSSHTSSSVYPDCISENQETQRKPFNFPKIEEDLVDEWTKDLNDNSITISRSSVRSNESCNALFTITELGTDENKTEKSSKFKTPMDSKSKSSQNSKNFQALHKYTFRQAKLINDLNKINSQDCSNSSDQSQSDNIRRVFEVFVSDNIRVQELDSSSNNSKNFKTNEDFESMHRMEVESQYQENKHINTCTDSSFCQNSKSTYKPDMLKPYLVQSNKEYKRQNL